MRGIAALRRRTPEGRDRKQCVAALLKHRNEPFGGYSVISSGPGRRFQNRRVRSSAATRRYYAEGKKLYGKGDVAPDGKASPREAHFDLHAELAGKEQAEQRSIRDRSTYDLAEASDGDR